MHLKEQFTQKWTLMLSLFIIHSPPKKIWNFTAKQCCSILLNNWSRGGRDVKRKKPTPKNPIPNIKISPYNSSSMIQVFIIEFVDEDFGFGKDVSDKFINNRDLWASGELVYVRWAVRSCLLSWWACLGLSPSMSAVKENAAKLFCSESPEMFCGLQNFTQFSIGIHFWVKLLFNKRSIRDNVFKNYHPTL